jgi:DNA polymerase-3 subunit epsilon
MNLIFCDIETTGLDPSRHEIISISIIIDTPQGTETYSHKVIPEHIDTASPEALRINHYSPEAWADAIPLEQATQDIARRIKGGLFIGWNPKFDMLFIKAALRKHGHPTPRVRLIDCMVLAHEHLIGLHSLSLTSVRTYLGLSNALAHTAVQDARDTRRIYYMLYRCTMFTRIWLAVKYMWRNRIK